MTRENPRHYRTLTSLETGEVRHLLVIFLNGSAETQLVMLSGGLETIMGTGTEFETELLADTLAQAWREDQNFREPKQGDFAFEPLEHSIALAKRLGFSILYDPRFKKSAFPNPNFTGAVPLGEWPGLTAKNGGRYTYAVDQMRFHARPTLPTHGAKLTAPSDPKEFAAFAAKIAEDLKAVGTFETFILDGDGV